MVPNKRDYSCRICIAIIIFTIFHVTSISALNQKKYSFSFLGFDEGKNHSSFSFLGGNSSIDGGALQLTPDTSNTDFGFRNKSGRILYHRPFKLWSSSDNTNNVVSFNSTFVLNIFRERTWNAGEGFSFLIAPDKTTIPDNSWGQWLGLTNATTDNKTENHIVAVEFDTERQDFDPDDNHIGLNINSVVSKTTVSLNESGIEISPENATKYTVWIEYNGSSKLMEVYIAKKPDPKPNKPILSEIINLKDYLKQESYFGFSGSTGSPAIQLNCVLEWSLEIDEIEEENDLNSTGLKIGIGVGVGTFVLIGACGVKVGVVLMKKRKKTVEEESEVLGTLKRLPGMPREFRFKELKKATQKFDEKMVLGRGGFGVVYKGIMEDRVHIHGVAEIAVKKFLRDSIKGKDDFLAELTIIHRLRHKHLVRLVGWCHEKRKLLLVYDFMPNGSLENHLYNTTQPTLNWQRRYTILEGVASALHYLHNEYDQKVLHRDLKASNILLDSNFNARLGDFGLARALDPERNSYVDITLGGVPGTMGYVAPECFHTGKATPESDVFGFGAVVLEVVCGKRPGAGVNHEGRLHSLVDWVWTLHREGNVAKAVDERLNNDFLVDETQRLLFLGLACSHPIANERPQTKDIVQIISGSLPVPYVPPFKPIFTWSSLAFATETTETTLSSRMISS